ncbi:MAG: hypothetical protein JNK27_00065 [Chitinophagaceae bacterium]|nr:hypothetical protein [Chitinophagaceae bacterium]
MDRQIIVIKGFSKTPEELELDRHYSQTYMNFFNSRAGGAYSAAEIQYHEDISAADLNKLTKALISDFIILVLIGHGATQVDNQLFQLNEKEIIRPGQLEFSAPKQMILLESCRSEIEGVFSVDLNDKIPKFKYGGVVRSPITREQARQLYNEQLASCKDGQVVCFACAKGQAATNYYFSLVLLQAAFDWHLGPGPHLKTMNIDFAMDYIMPEVNRLSTEAGTGPQTPTILPSIPFPFAVSKF